MIRLNTRNLWLRRVASPEFAKEVSDIRYGNESYGYNKVGYVDVGVVEKAKDPK